MRRENIIVIVKPEVESFGNFKKLCEAKKLPYHSLKKLSFPIFHGEYEIHKVKFN